MIEHFSSDSRNQALARVLSHLMSPACLAAVLLPLVGRHFQATGAHIGLAFGLYVLLPGCLVLLMSPWSHSADLYAPTAALRQRILFSGTYCYIGSYVVLSGIGAHPALLWVGASFALGSAAVLVINRWWKISIHVTGAGGAAVLGAVSLSPTPLWLALPTLAAWARLRRGAHTRSQVLAGCALGASITGLLGLYYI
ncbi:MAG: hypothetical protein VX733_05440 [Candidatus Latescibacterota bacterium]|nr:hypothetical protein [Candidatus Latescibacterota bacterium]